MPAPPPEPVQRPTAVADALVRRGIPFRAAHHIVGSLVAQAEGAGIGLDEIPDAMLGLALGASGDPAAAAVAEDPAIGEFIDRHPTIKMLALAFIILVGVALICDGLGVHIARGYLYFAMAFSAAVEALNLLARRRQRKRREKAAPRDG